MLAYMITNVSLWDLAAASLQTQIYPNWGSFQNQAKEFFIVLLLISLTLY